MSVGISESRGARLDRIDEERKIHALPYLMKKMKNLCTTLLDEENQNLYTTRTLFDEEKANLWPTSLNEEEKVYQCTTLFDEEIQIYGLPYFDEEKRRKNLCTTSLDEEKENLPIHYLT